MRGEYEQCPGEKWTGRMKSFRRYGGESVNMNTVFLLPENHGTPRWRSKECGNGLARGGELVLGISS